MEKFIFFCIVIFFSALTGCKTERSVSFEAKGAEETSIQEPTTLIQSPFTFIDVVLEGDTLIAHVQYSGGCGNHEFEIEKMGFLMKSLPPKQPIKITHRSDNDPCRARIRKELKFNIVDFRGTPTGTTVLLLENWTQRIVYSY